MTALSIANPYVAAEVMRGVDETASGRLVTSVAAYASRLRYRTTPFGLFAGVSLVPVDSTESTSLLLRGWRSWTRPSPEFLQRQAMGRFGLDSELSAIRIGVAHCTAVRGSRYVTLAPGETASARARFSQSASVPRLPVVKSIISLARSHPTLQQVIDRLAEESPATPRSESVELIRRLLQAGFLVSDIVPDATVSAPAAWTMERVGHLNELSEATSVCAEFDSAPFGASTVPPRFPVHADLAAELEGSLPTSVGDDLAEAVALLTRCFPVHADFRSGLTAWHARFVEAWGHHRLIPALAALDPVRGLGPLVPEGSVQPPGANTWQAQRAAVLGELAATAAAHGRREIFLDDAIVERLISPAAGQVPRSVEVLARIIASSPADLARGRYRLHLLGSGSQQAGAMVGRFAPLLTGQRALDVFAAQFKGTDLAEVVYRPRFLHTRFLSAKTGWTDRRIVIDQSAGGDDLTPDDLLIGATADRLYLVSRRDCRRVRPVVFDRLDDPARFPLVNLLEAISCDGAMSWEHWNWGPIGRHLSFTPRVSRGPVVLSPATWRLPADLVAAAKTERWNQAIDRWRDVTSPPLPGEIVVGVDDQHLLVDFSATGRALLRRQVLRGATHVWEPPESAAWLPGPTGKHIVDVVMPLFADGPANGETRIPVKPLPAAAARPPGAGLWHAGETWLTVIVPALIDCQDELLARVAKVLADEAWFFLRYQDAHVGHHLRIRVRGTSAHLRSVVVPAIIAWSETMTRSALCKPISVVSYDPEIERYGGPEVMEAAENVFRESSRLAIATLNRVTNDRLVTATAMALDITDHVCSGEWPYRPVDLERSERRRVMDVRPATRDYAFGAPPPLAEAVWEGHRSALIDLQKALGNATTATPAQVGAALIHMTANRILLGRELELSMHALSVDALRTRRNRSARS
ncbi:lantibiotic dehydratase [Microbispora sp. CA-102843]|uniref:lantibiotic dehydratase n=1 Tax=Microbispora sp. CA-102843 TaxID=3239952 RepID=UPI003D8DC581